jgi:hypothetical protein
MNTLRIYTYRISFEEVPYYYYGVHKEKNFNEEYYGSPVTNRWCWETYTPKKQILEYFVDWEEAQRVEARIIKEFYNKDKWCLNENCAGYISLQKRSEAGKVGGKRGSAKCKEMGIGIFGMSSEKRTETAKKSVKQAKKNKTGIFALTKEQLVENGKKGGIISSKKLNSQKWMCLETGMVSTIGPLTRYQKVRGIDTSKKVKINN